MLASSRGLPSGPIGYNIGDHGRVLVFRLKVRKVGNSLGFTLPADAVGKSGCFGRKLQVDHTTS